MKHFVLTFILATLLSSNAFCLTAWEIYIQDPSPENAKKVSTVEYSGPELTEKEDYQRLDNQMSILQSKVLDGDKEALLLTFRLEGADHHDISDIIGSSVTAHPRIYLEVVGTFQFGNCPYVDHTDCVDDIDLCAFQVEETIKLISSVEDPALEEVKGMCLSSLYEGLDHVKLLQKKHGKSR